MLLNGVIYSSYAVLGGVVHNGEFLVLDFKQGGGSYAGTDIKSSDPVLLAIYNLQSVGLLVGNEDPVCHFANDYGGLRRAPATGNQEKAGAEGTR